MKKVKMSHLGKMHHALAEVAELTEFGNSKKYSPFSWLYHDNSIVAKKFAEKRMDSLARHVMLALDDMDSIDEESGQHHLAAVAWNALAILELKYRYCINKPNVAKISATKNRVTYITPNCS